MGLVVCWLVGKCHSSTGITGDRLFQLWLFAWTTRQAASRSPPIPSRFQVSVHFVLLTESLQYVLSWDIRLATVYFRHISLFHKPEPQLQIDILSHAHAEPLLLWSLYLVLWLYVPCSNNQWQQHIIHLILADSFPMSINSPELRLNKPRLEKCRFTKYWQRVLDRLNPSNICQTIF